MADVSGDDAVAVTVQDAAVAQVRAAREDEERAGGRPRFLEQDGLGDGDDGVVGAEQPAKGVDAVPDRGEGRAGACGVISMGIATRR